MGKSRKCTLKCPSLDNKSDLIDVGKEKQLQSTIHETRSVRPIKPWIPLSTCGTVVSRRTSWNFGEMDDGYVFDRLRTRFLFWTCAIVPFFYRIKLTAVNDMMIWFQKLVFPRGIKSDEVYTTITVFLQFLPCDGSFPTVFWRTAGTRKLIRCGPFVEWVWLWLSILSTWQRLAALQKLKIRVRASTRSSMNVAFKP